MKGRLLSIDVLRGMTLIFMIIVNQPGSWDNVFAPLLHADWNGLTPTDYIFPNFLFIVGVSIVLSLFEAAGTGVVFSSELEELCIDSTILATAFETLLSIEDVIEAIEV